MSKAGRFLILDPQKTAAISDDADIAAKPCPQNVPRQKLADISNLPNKHKGFVEEEKSQRMSGTIKEYIEHLKKDNVALSNILGQKNKIISERGTELERLRANLIKVQEQNRQLALSHSKLLADLNTGKDRLKALQHEIGCKKGLLKASELEKNAGEGQCQHADVETNLGKFQEEEKLSKESRDDHRKPHNAKRGLRSSNLDDSESIQSDMNAGNNKRPCTRRQSARFKVVELKHAVDLPETDNANSVLENRSTTSVNVEVKREDDNNGRASCVSSESQEFGRSSLCRPSRLATKKVHSYKEIPLNVKMRRHG